MNLEYRQKILDQFDNDIVPVLLEFGERLSLLQSDVFVLMSRKFCCLYKLLLSIGIAPIPKDKMVVSDKLLDADTNYFRGKVVTIVDDIIICGSTIRKVRNKLLKQLGAIDVKVYAICTDKEYWVKEMVEPDYPITVLPDNKALTFCSSIVSALSIAPIPYSVEYPVFENIEVTIDEWNLFSWLGGWIVKDITSRIQEENDIAVFTVFPSSVISRKIIKVFGEKFYDLFGIIKIRIYAKQKDNQITFSMMPLIAIKPLSKQHLDEIFDFIIENLNMFGCSEKTISNFNNEFIQPGSRLRFIQYTASLCLYLFFKDSITQTLHREIFFDIKDMDIELLFGRDNVESVREMVNCFFVKKKQFFKLRNIKKFIINSKKLNDIMPVKIDDCELDFLFKGTPKFSEVRDILADFKDIFLKYYYERELPTRKEIKEEAKEDVEKALENSDRLEKGITWSQILIYFYRIADCDSNKEFEMSLSLVLDYSIDRGICVPIIQYDKEKNIVYRSYRHGEDVLFAEQQLALCKLVIQSAQEAMGTDDIPKTFLEKLLVLFIKVGVKKEIFEKHYNVDGQVSFARIDFNLHGAIAKYYDKNTRSSNRDVWLHEYLIEKNIIRKKGGSYSVVDKIDDNVLKVIQNTDAAKEAVHFGTLIGKLSKGFELKQGKVNLTIDELIYITTCDTSRDVSKALRAEVDIFLNQYNRLLKIIKEEKPQTDNQNVLANNNGYKALNSMHMKTAVWAKNKANNVIEDWHNLLKKEGKIQELIDWDAYCNTIRDSDSLSVKERFNKHIISFSNISHRLLFYLDLFRVSCEPNEMKILLDFYNNTNNLTQEIISNKILGLINNNETMFLSDEEKKYFDIMYECYTNYFENPNRDKFEAPLMPIIPKLEFYTAKVKKELLAFISTLREQEREEYAELCDYIVDFDIIDPTEIDKKLFIRDNNKFKIIKHQIDCVLNEVNILRGRMIAKYNETSQTGIILSDEDEQDKPVFFPKNDKLNIPFIKKYVQELLKISKKADNVYFRIVVYSADEFSNRISLKKKYNRIINYPEYNNFQKKFKENEKTYGIPQSGTTGDRFSNLIFLKGTVIVVDNAHEQSIGRQLGLKLIKEDKVKINGNNIPFEIYKNDIL
jgi:hypoxanthine phosphoribosyltransferase